MNEEKVILVDKNDQPLGLMPKMEAHRRGVLHRAFSVFIFNDKGQLLLQQRASHKYHSPGLWTNTVCSHQRQGEDSIQAGRRRLYEEMGFSTGLREIFSFIYRAEFDNGLIEHELDHVLIGRYNADPDPNPGEVSGYRWIYLSDLIHDISKHPENYTAWFRIIFEKSFEKLLNEAGRMFLSDPVVFHPHYETKPWGGNALKEILHKNPPRPNTGESWEISAVPGKESRITSGIFKGFTTNNLWQWLDEGFWKHWKNRGKTFPLLIKYIDARQKLSVQVHPGDEMAGQLHNSYGKNEAWRIVHASPGAQLYLGFKDGTSQQDFLQALQSESIDKLLRSVPVKAGDMFYIPAGTVHSIGAGILLAEVQQSSDITYRIFDWNRSGLNGKPRPLHTELALKAIRWDARPEKVPDNHLHTPYFDLDEIKISNPQNFNFSGPCIVQNIGTVNLKTGQHTLAPGQTAVFWPGNHTFQATPSTQILVTSLSE